MKDDMKAITANVKKIKLEKEAEERVKATAKAKKVGRKDAKAIIEKLPARIKAAAEKGDNSVCEWCYSGSEHGGYKFGFIGEWARKQGFKTEYKRNCEGANEGQDNMNYLTISWE